MMRDCNINVNNDLNETFAIAEGKAIYKEIVIVGNGPSGITLSFILNGYWPFYNRKTHPDPMLSARLIECTHKSLLHQDLEFLAQGLEGRSKNPVSLLIDCMSHPAADMGLEWPSLLTWKKTNNTMEHVVLGKGDPGGAWQGIPENMLTISPGRWMCLPGMEMKECGREGRVPAPTVLSHYNQYVQQYGLAKNMVNNVTVTHIQPILNGQGTRRARWRVVARRGNVSNNNDIVEYECRHLVLATGSSDRAGCLGVPGESLPFVTHDLKGLQQRLAPLPSQHLPSGVLPQPLKPTDNLPDRSGFLDYIRRLKQKRRRSFNGLSRSLDSSDSEINIPASTTSTTHPRSVLVVGAGLSAADAVLMSHKRGHHVTHVFRRGGTTNGPRLPALVYPEYHEVYRLMEGAEVRPDYCAYRGFHVKRFDGDGRVTLFNDEEEGEVTVDVAVAAVLIGSQPDLSFVPAKLRSLGVDVDKPVDCKANPIHIDPYSYRCLRAPPGLYAIGPLVGDNFVRFLQGGAVGVAGHIFKDSSAY